MSTIRDLLAEHKTLSHTARHTHDRAEATRVYDHIAEVEAKLLFEGVDAVETVARDVARIATAMEWIAVSLDILAGKN